MWPLLLDMTKEESMQSLRCLELEAYAGLVSALRAQGSLSTEKMKLLKDTSAVLNISQERHKAEVRRAVNDEKLNTIAYHVSGQKVTSEDWALEGKRLIPLMARIAPQTAYSAIADEVADTASKNNKMLPSPSSTERKRAATISIQSGMSDINKPVSFRMPEPPKSDESKKRKLQIPLEGSSLAQHLMGPPKMSKIQQIYRQKTKARQKELQLKLRQDPEKQEGIPAQPKLQQQQLQVQQPIQQKLSQSNPIGSPKVNIIQNISLPTTEVENVEVKTEPLDITNSSCKLSEISNALPQPGCSNENQVVKAKSAISGPKLNQHITLKHVTSSSPNSEKQIKVCSARKNLTTKCITTGQKLIVVSNPQSITTSSILQRTLTIPFVKNISVKNFDKFKIVTTNAGPNIQLTTLPNSGQTTPGKHKVVTVRTNPTVKKVIPLSQLQVLNAKGSIKVLPIGGKIVTKTNAGQTPLYIVNSGNMQCITKSTTSTPIIMTCKTQDSADNKSLLVLKSPDISGAKTIADLASQVHENEELSIKAEVDDKRNVIADIIEAVGVVSPHSENDPTDTQVETKDDLDYSENIVKLEEIKEECGVIVDQRTELDTNKEEILENNINSDETTTIVNDPFTYVVEEKSSAQMSPDIKLETCEDSSNNAGTLDPTTGLYNLPPTDDVTYEPSIGAVSKETVIVSEPMAEDPND